MTMSNELKMSMLASKAAAGLARTLIGPRLEKWGCAHISDDAFLITTELVTNASTATPGKEIKICVSRDPAGILLAVWDSNDQIPQPKPIVELTPKDLDLVPADWDTNGGWGLPIVQALSIDCGYKRDPAGGKWIWARLKP